MTDCVGELWLCCAQCCTLCDNNTQTKKKKKTLNNNKINEPLVGGKKQPGQVQMSRFSNLRY